MVVATDLATFFPFFFPLPFVPPVVASLSSLSSNRVFFLALVTVSAADVARLRLLRVDVDGVGEPLRRRCVVDDFLRVCMVVVVVVVVEVW